MNVRIETSTEKKLMGMRLTMSLSNNKTGDLWARFMKQRKEIQNNIDTNLYSMQIYDPLYYTNFNPAAVFEKWATVEVTDFDLVPPEMETYTLTEGLYAVFSYKGAASEGAKAFQYIFTIWLPNSIYTLDNRPHFEILGTKYKNEDPDSEEEIWIPIQLKNELK
jgi:AraC family transcriptional regulator